MSLMWPLKKQFVYFPDKSYAGCAATITNYSTYKLFYLHWHTTPSLKAGIPQQVLFEMASIYGWDIDFALDLRQGDSFSLIYDEIYLDGEQIGTGHILATEFNNRGRTIRAVRYTDKNGKSDYYTPEGQS